MVTLQHNLWYKTACVQYLLNLKLLSMGELKSITLMQKRFPHTFVFLSHPYFDLV